MDLKDKGNPVPSLDDIQVIEDLLEKDGMSEFDNDPRDAYFNGVRAGIQTYFEHYHSNGVETNKEQPKTNDELLKEGNQFRKDWYSSKPLF